MNEPYTVQVAQQIIEQTAHYFHLTVAELNAPEQKMHLSIPRQVATFLIRRRWGKDMSFPEIGRLLGYRDHTSPMRNYAIVQGHLKTGFITEAQLAAIGRGEVCECIEKYRRQERKTVAVFEMDNRKMEVA